MTENLTTTLRSATQTTIISREQPTVIIGERINPTGRKKVLEALEAGDFESVRRDARDQVAAGAQVLDVNAGVPGADEPALLTQVMQVVMDAVDVPLCIDTANPDALEAALSVYQGKALVNSVNGDQRALEAVLPIVRKHGAAVIGLCMDESGIPPTPDARLAVAHRIVNRATGLGIPLEDIVIDPLVLTMGADHRAGLVTLQTIARLVVEFGVNVTAGASNVSYGMPDRRYINATFVALAIQAGVTCPITNPLEEQVALAIQATDLALGRDPYGMTWIKAYRARKKQAAAAP